MNTTPKTTATIKITRELRKQINQAVRDNVGGANPLAEVGLRGEPWQPNALQWAADSDLGDLVRLALLTEIDGDARHPGCAELDLYVTTGTGCDRQLETNVCILIRDGKVVGATSEGREIAALKQRIGFPLGDWDDITDAIENATTPAPQPATPSIALRAGRELTERGDYGVKRQLRAVQNSPAVYWSKNHNSYVAVQNEDGTYRVLSINGIGEIRWSLDPHNPGWQCDNDGPAAIDYFFVIEGGAR